MRTLSVRQPWAWLIVNGHKDVENRTWPTLYRGPLLIHASKTVCKRDFEAQRAEVLAEFGVQVPELDDLPRGGVVGQARLTHCAATSASRWHLADHHAWALADAKPLPFYPCKGGLSFFNVPLTDMGMAPEAD